MKLIAFGTAIPMATVGGEEVGKSFFKKLRKKFGKIAKVAINPLSLVTRKGSLLRTMTDPTSLLRRKRRRPAAPAPLPAPVSDEMAPAPTVVPSVAPTVTSSVIPPRPYAAPPSATPFPMPRASFDVDDGGDEGDEGDGGDGEDGGDAGGDEGDEPSTPRLTVNVEDDGDSEDVSGWVDDDGDPIQVGGVLDLLGRRLWRAGVAKGR